MSPTSAQITSEPARGGSEYIFLIAEAESAPYAAHVLAPSLPAGLSLVHIAPCSMAYRQTVQGVAADLIQAVQNVQKHGPYRLVGWESAGLHAYELTTQLIGLDEDVECLALIDTEYECELETQPIPVNLFGEQALLDRWASTLPGDRLNNFILPKRAASQGGPKWEAALASSLKLLIAGSASKHRRILEEHRYKALCPIHSENSDSAVLVCVPGAGANAADFVPLANSLDSAYQVFAFQPRGAAGNLVPHTTVEAAARMYHGELGEISRNGSLHLLGHSFGGWVALELALLMQAEGCTIESLTILDSEVPAAEDVQLCEYTRAQALMRLVSLYEQAAQKTMHVRIEDFETRSFQQQLDLLHSRVVQVGLMSARSAPSSLRGTVRTFEAALRTRYRPASRFLGRARLFLIKEDGESDSNAHLRMHRTATAWQHFAPELIPRWGSGNHVTLLKQPNIEMVAACMLSSIRKARNAGSGITLQLS